MENNYYNYETPYFDKPGFAEPNSADKYRNITNVSQLLYQAAEFKRIYN